MLNAIKYFSAIAIVICTTASCASKMDSVITSYSIHYTKLYDIVRLCLAVGVEVIFIPPYTPKANGSIESFNDLWNTNFWRRTEFRDVAHVQTELPLFETYCRHRRPLPELEGQSADQIEPDFEPFLLPPEFDLHQHKRLAIRAGFVHFFRFVSSKGTFSLS